KTAAGTREHLLFLHKWAQERNTFVADRTFIISLACIHCCARYDDIANAKQADLKIGTDRVTLVQHKSKTDQNSEEGIVHPMPRANDERLCPVINFQKWRRRREVGLDPENALFPTARDKNNATPYSMYAENLKEAQMLCKLPRLTPHSWRCGYATYAAAAGLDAATIVAASRWRQLASAEGYVRRSTELRMQATAKALNF
ncbi:MAG: tyrosine-type recombinase/integrase, partial [Gammaproteobacteria bacterium]|nr:tyrosine-type recombinase/integrase [Gammaproteobacteria bacterium]